MNTNRIVWWMMGVGIGLGSWAVAESELSEQQMAGLDEFLQTFPEEKAGPVVESGDPLSGRGWNPTQLVDLEKIKAYNHWTLEHRKRAFEWQQTSTYGIFGVVLAMVVAGVVLAWLQFKRGEPGGNHTIKLSTKGIELSSPFLGLMILAMSLGFFYLYIVHVYELTEVGKSVALR